jgi:hypothetical protein
MTITLKKVPRALHLSLKRQAKLHKRSLNQEALACLEATVEIDARQKRAFEDICQYREKLARLGVKGMSTVEIRNAINEGRE